MAGGGDLEFVAGQEVHGEAADFLTGVVGDGDGLGVLGTVRFFVCGPVMACRQAGPDFHQVGLMNRSPYRIAN